jgi:hypothetical protein
LIDLDLTMSVTLSTTTHAAGPKANLSKPGVVVPHVKSPILYTIDDLLFSRSQTIPDVPLVAYPATSKGKADYSHYTAKDLDRFADHGALRYSSMGLKPEACSSQS